MSVYKAEKHRKGKNQIAKQFTPYNITVIIGIIDYLPFVAQSTLQPGTS
jgi:hypothetical protein